MNDWIKVEDSPPPIGERLLVCKYYLTNEWDWENGGYLSTTIATYLTMQLDRKTANGWELGGRVTHWMHTPEMPKDVK